MKRLLEGRRKVYEGTNRRNEYDASLPTSLRSPTHILPRRNDTLFIATTQDMTSFTPTNYFTSWRS